MKYLAAFILILSCHINSKAQVTSPQDTVIVINGESAIFTKVDVEASFAGGQEAWSTYLMNNLDIDKVSKKIRIPKGETELREVVIVKFVVNKLGEISDVTAENADANPYCIREAIRVIRDSPNWVPAKQNGKSVNAYRRQPITFLFTR